MTITRILHVVSSLSLSNGIMNVIINYYRHINLNEIQFDFLYFEDDEISYKDEIYSLGGRVFKIEPPRIKNIFFYRQYLRNYINKQKRFDYNIIHFHEIVLLSLISPILREFGCEKIIAHSHSVVYSYHPIKSMRNRTLSIGLKKSADYYCACSEASGRFWFGQELMNEGKVHIINNAIDCEKFYYNPEVRSKIRNELGIDNSLVIGHVGRFSKEKNHEFLIEVFYELTLHAPNCKLILIGSGPELNKVKEKVAFLKLDKKVIFLGQRFNVYEFYQAMDVFVFPSISEGLGSVAIEAQVAGLPCIISDTVTSEVDISNKVEFLSLESQVENWAMKIRETDCQKNDMRQLAIEKGYSIKNEAEKLEHFYERLLAE